MNIGEIIHGFRITSERELTEHCATLYLGEHIKSGASLIFCQRPDANKTFSITFKTVPEDDTGVFHILEHSVLCGSRKFPVKEPFVDLLKSSLKTFLNAFTFPDKTMYPVSSRCDKDFLNLIDVYMDAVLHPMALSRPEIFYQEGWHYELHEKESEMTYKGVVLNEMRGAYSSVEDLEGEYITRLLYRGTPYACDSGGEPDAITTLTYEDFKRAHARFYHPSNSTVFLDGTVDLEKTLSLIDSYLCEYERQPALPEIPSPSLVGEQALVAEYEIAEGESEQGRERISLSFPTFSYLERENHSAAIVALESIAGSNESPLKKAILDAALCEDMQLYPYDGVKDNSISVIFKNVRSENREKIIEAFYTELRRILSGGIDKERLDASINRFAFHAKDAQAGGYPFGIALSIAAMDNALYGGDPYDSMRLDKTVFHLRELYKKPRGYEELLSRIFLSPPYYAKLILTPSSTLGKRRDDEIRARLKSTLDAMTAEEKSSLIALTDKIEQWQRSDDTDEARATLPKLTLDDIPKEPEILPTTIYKSRGSTVIHTDFPSRGITHYHLLFDASDLSGEELFLLTLFFELIENVDTEHYRAERLQTLIKSNLGRLSGSVVTLGAPCEPRCYAKLTASMLDEKRGIAAELISEILLSSKFDSRETISKLIRQIYIDTRDSISQSGHTVALSRASAYVSSESAAGEYIDGIEFYKLIRELDKSYAGGADSLSARLTALARRVFTRDRMLISYVGTRDDELTEKLASAIPRSNEGAVKYSPIAPLGILNEGIAVPAQVSFAAEVGMVLKRGERLDGAYSVVRSILSYDYLWNEIRVQGGAYGAGLVQRAGGIVGFYTYRDPSASRSIDKFRGASEFLRKIADSGESLDEYIIGAISDFDPLYTPMSAGIYAFTRYLRGEDDASLRERRQQLLTCNKDDLYRIADKLDEICALGAICVVGGKEKIARCGSVIKSIVEIV